MFVLPAVILPVIFLLAITRLYQIPRRLLSGALRVPARRRGLLAVVTVAAYLMLLGYTVALAAALVHALCFAPDRWPAYLSVALYALAYPVVYFMAAWIFYYGLESSGPPVR